MKDIVIIANFIADIDDEANGRFTYLANLLNEDNKVEIITSDFSHNKKERRKLRINQFPYSITLIHESGYSRNVCGRRFFSHWIWGKNVYKYLLKREKPDVIYCAVPSLTAALKTSKYCKSNNVKYIIDIQDLWPEAFQMVLDIPVLSDIIFLPFKQIANQIYQAADDVVAVSQTYADRALTVNKKCKKGHVVFLGTKLKTFDQNVKENIYNRKDNKIWLGYCGTLGSSYDLTCVIDALALLKDRFDIKFIIMGDGPRRSEFEKYAQKKKVATVFTGRLNYPQMCALLSVCDIAVNPITHSAAQSIINKHADYAAAGIPVINTQECVEYRNLVENYHMGFNCKNSDPMDMSAKLQILIENEMLRIEMGKNARHCAEEKFDREKTYLEILDILKK